MASPAPYKMYKFKCKKGHSLQEWTGATSISNCPSCGRVVKKFGKYNPYIEGK